MGIIVISLAIIYVNTASFIATIYESMASSERASSHSGTFIISRAARVEPLYRLLKGDKIPLERVTAREGWAKLQLIN